MFAQGAFEGGEAARHGRNTTGSSGSDRRAGELALNFIAKQLQQVSSVITVDEMLFAMHAPDGFLEPGTALVTGLITLAVVAVSLRMAGRELGDRQVPLAGIAAAFIFAAQMFNFPVAAGTTGHLMGGALAAILLGPWVGTLVVTIVVVVQALLFADGGLTALGYNTMNMAIVTAFGGWAAFQLFRRFLPKSSAGVVGFSTTATPPCRSRPSRNALRGRR